MRDKFHKKVRFVKKYCRRGLYTQNFLKVCSDPITSTDHLNFEGRNRKRGRGGNSSRKGRHAQLWKILGYLAYERLSFIAALRWFFPAPMLVV
jgi:hypothetical protein